MEKDISNSEFSIFAFRLFLSVCGIKLKNDPFPYLNHYLLILLMQFFLIASQSLLLFFEIDFYLRSTIFINFIHVANYTFTWSKIYGNRKTLKLMLKTVRKGIYQYPPKMARYVRRPKPKILVLKILFFVSVGAFLIVVFTPLIYFILGGRSPSYESLIYEGWYPWKVNSQRAYFLTYALQICMSYPSCFLALNALFLVYFILVVKDQTNLLIFATQNVISESINKTSSGHETRNTTETSSTSEISNTNETSSSGKRPNSTTPGINVQEIKEFLLECVRHHRAMIR